METPKGGLGSELPVSTGGGGGVLNQRTLLTLNNPLQLGGDAASSGDMRVMIDSIDVNDIGITFLDQMLAPAVAPPLYIGQFPEAGLYSIHCLYVVQVLQGGGVTQQALTLAVSFTDTDGVFGGNFSPVDNHNINSTDQPGDVIQGEVSVGPFWCTGGPQYPASIDGLFACSFLFSSDGTPPGMGLGNAILAPAPKQFALEIVRLA